MAEGSNKKSKEVSFEKSDFGKKIEENKGMSLIYGGSFTRKAADSDSDSEDDDVGMTQSFKEGIGGNQHLYHDRCQGKLKRLAEADALY